MMTVDGPTLGELARQVQEVFARFEAIATRIETAFVTKEFHLLQTELLETKIDSLKQDIESIESDKVWLVRLVFSCLIVAFLGAGFALSKVTH